MEELQVELGERSYPIFIGAGLLEDRCLMGKVFHGEDLLVVSNETVAPLYLDRLEAVLGAGRVESCVLDDGEQYKTWDNASRILDALANGGFHRDAVVVALGGGVVGDIAGFAAACYQRGIAFVQLPTTLLAQVDSSVGGKTGVNHPRGKNLLGAFHQPRCVVADISTLKTLNAREYRAGLAEVIKYGLIHDAEFFDYLENNLSGLLEQREAVLERTIRRCCEIKAEIVAEDEREQGKRALLNFGHSFGHAIETALGYGVWLHGEAVAAGMVLASRLSLLMGWLDPAELRRITKLLESAGLPVRAPDVEPARLLELMQMDKKVLRGNLRLILLRSIGRAAISDDYPEESLMEVLDSARAVS